ncbi:MAG: sodium:alanine symporter family protein [Clostridia bacterium]|nr:sodium:alanine symporter family protein [Clostridia bacterium]
MSGAIIGFISWLQEFVWGVPLIASLYGTGLYFSFKSGFFQITHIGTILKSTVFSVFKKKQLDKGGLTPFQSFATSLAATLGNGNIAGVATAITLGGPGAVFWMWVSAIIGSMTAFAENALGVFYRHKKQDGSLRGGTMYMVYNAVKSKRIADVFSTSFAFFCLLASFGMGNTVQTNTITSAINATAVYVDPKIIGLAVSVLLFIAIMGGTKRIARINEVFLPLISIFYIVGALSIVFKNIALLPGAFRAIFNGAFGLGAFGGGAVGYTVKNAFSVGVRRGVFSNEAGMGSLVIINSETMGTTPKQQGMWGIFEVQFDTIIMCSLTALAILCSGEVDLYTGVVTSDSDGAALVSRAFSQSLGEFSGVFIAVSTVFFAFSTLLGWSFYGIRCTEYLFGEKAVLIYKVVFSVASYFGAVADLRFIWMLSDVFNGLMAVPNIICIMFLSKTAVKLLKCENNLELSS